MLRALIVCALALLMVGSGVDRGGAAGAERTQAVSEEEASAVALVNQLRAGRGLAALVADPTLGRLARTWAMELVATGRLAHFSGLGSDPRPEWERLGENVGRGVSLEDIEDSFQRSPTHLANLVDPQFDSVGIAVIHDAAGLVYVVQRFQETVATVAPGTARPTDTRAPARLAARAKPRRAGR